ncbi:MAG: hypothetical protein SFU99_10420 [Saprospiraceae bacterium]|nr:hypothetical protein [Saprospiraceae bacterium]
MSVSHCENCQTRNPGLMQGKCITCDYPIEGSKEEKRNYRNKLSDTKHYLRKIDGLPRNFLNFATLIFLVMFGMLILVFLFSPFNLYAVVALLIVSIYFGLIGWKLNPFNKLWILVLGSIYLFVTAIEFLIFGLPTRLLYGFGVEDGWIGFMPIANSLSPFMYLVFRLCLLIPFGAGLIYHLRIENTSEKLVDYAIAQVKNMSSSKA